MSTPESDLRARREAVVREHMEAENRLDWDATLATFRHPRYELVATGQVFDGEEEVRGYYLASRAAFPDQRNEIHALHHADAWAERPGAGDGAVIVEFDLLGTHEGEFLGVAPTGRDFRVRMAAFFLFDDEHIVVERIYFDAGSILRQLGIT